MARATQAPGINGTPRTRVPWALSPRSRCPTWDSPGPHCRLGTVSPARDCSAGLRNSLNSEGKGRRQWEGAQFAQQTPCSFGAEGH